MLISKQNLQVMLILSLVLIAAYAPLLFLNYSYNPSYDSTEYSSFAFAKNFACVGECIHKNYMYTLDLAASGFGGWPLIQTTTNMYLEGNVPLWNPYLFGGYPMFAEITNLSFSPLLIFYFLPQAFWDFALVIPLWFMGLFTYFLLRQWKLNHVSSLCGSIIFMLSGPFTWLLPHESLPVIIFMPLILYSIEQIFKSNNFKFVFIGSLSITASILGTHLESILLVMFITISYVIFRSLINFKLNESREFENFDQSLIQKIRQKIPFLSLIIMIGTGIGMSLFFIIPGLEFISQSYLLREGQSAGATVISPYYALSTLFIPYIIGAPHQFLSVDRNIDIWNVPIGYIVASSLVFSIIGLSTNIKSNFHRWLARFFMGLSVLLILKSIGLPLLNDLGYLPILEHIIFPRYSIFIITFGLAITTSIGVNSLITNRLSFKKLLILLGVSFMILAILVLLLLPEISEKPLAHLYVQSQVFISLTFVIFSVIFIIFYQKKFISFNSLLFLIILESILYVPMGMSPLWQNYKAIITISGIGIILLTSLLSVKLPNLKLEKNLFAKLVVILILVVAINQIIFLESPAKLTPREQIFTENDPIRFLKNNIQHHRIISFDNAFQPNFPAASQIQALGGLSSMNVKSFGEWKKHLDPYATALSLNFEQRHHGAPSFDIIYSHNKKLFDFLGVKYIVSFNTDPGTAKIFTERNNVIDLSNSSKRIIQEFTFTADSASSLAVWIENYGKINDGNIILELNSIPPSELNHRISKISASEIHGLTIFKFEKLSNVSNTRFQMSLYHEGYSPSNKIAVSKSHLDDIYIKNNHFINPELFIHGKKSDEYIPLVIPKKFPLVFDGKIKIFESTDVLPRSYLVTKYQVSESYDDIFNIISNPNFDFQNELILEENINEFPSSASSSENLKNSQVSIIKYTPNFVELKTDYENPSILVLTDTFYPGWHAFVDEKETEIFRANGLVRAVFVPSGNHTVTFSFMPDSFVIGVVMSILSFLILFVFYILHQKKLIMINNLLKNIRS